MIFHKICFKIRGIYRKLTCSIYILYLRLLGCNIGKRVNLSKIFYTWPHQVKIGNNVTLENGCYFKFDGIWKKGPSIIIGNDCFIGVNVEFNIKDNITIGDYTLIDSGSKFIDHDHGIDLKDLIKKQKCPTESIRIGNNVWIGDNVTILKGVVINDGAVIAAGAVVNKSINENEIWGGVPAKFIKIRL